MFAPIKKRTRRQDQTKKIGKKRDGSIDQKSNFPCKPKVNGKLRIA
jgi:hypothetical protein